MKILSLLVLFKKSSDFTIKYLTFFRGGYNALYKVYNFLEIEIALLGGIMAKYNKSELLALYITKDKEFSNKDNMFFYRDEETGAIKDRKDFSYLHPGLSLDNEIAGIDVGLDDETGYLLVKNNSKWYCCRSIIKHPSPSSTAVIVGLDHVRNVEYDLMTKEKGFFNLSEKFGSSITEMHWIDEKIYNPYGSDRFYHKPIISVKLANGECYLIDETGNKVDDKAYESIESYHSGVVGLQDANSVKLVHFDGMPIGEGRLVSYNYNYQCFECETLDGDTIYIDVAGNKYSTMDEPTAEKCRKLVGFYASQRLPDCWQLYGDEMSVKFILKLLEFEYKQQIHELDYLDLTEEEYADRVARILFDLDRSINYVNKCVAEYSEIIERQREEAEEAKRAVEKRNESKKKALNSVDSLINRALENISSSDDKHEV